MEIITVDMVPDYYNKPAECHTSQNDNGRQIEVKLTDCGEPYHLTGSEAIKLDLKTSSGESITQDVANTSENYVIITATRDMTRVSGQNMCRLTMTENAKKVSTACFLMLVEPKV